MSLGPHCPKAFTCSSVSKPSLCATSCQTTRFTSARKSPLEHRRMGPRKQISSRESQLEPAQRSPSLPHPAKNTDQTQTCADERISRGSSPGEANEPGPGAGAPGSWFYGCFGAIFTLSIVGAGLPALLTMTAVARIAPGGPSSVTRTDPPRGVPPGGSVRRKDGI